MNPWVSVVLSLVCKPLVTIRCVYPRRIDPIEEFAFCFHDSGRLAGQAL